MGICCMSQRTQTGALYQPGGVGWGGRFKRERIHVYLWLIHVEVWQKTTKFCKAIILQLKINKNLKIPLLNIMANLRLYSDIFPILFQTWNEYLQLYRIIKFERFPRRPQARSKCTDKFFLPEAPSYEQDLSLTESQVTWDLHAK